MPFIKVPDDFNLKLRLTLKETFRELIDENLYHIIKECKKNPEVKTIIDNDSYEMIKKNFRNEISKDCRAKIWDVVYYETNDYKQTRRATDLIMDIIRGE